MDIPEPPDPSGLWAEIKALANPFPQDSETQAYALADALDAAAGGIERAADDIPVIAGLLPAVWPDTEGLNSAESVRVLDTELRPLAQALRELAKHAREYGRTIVETKISLWIEIGASAALFVALLPFPGAAAGVVSRLAVRLAMLGAEGAGRLAASGPLQMAKHLLMQAGIGAATETGNSTTTQLLSMAGGHRDQFSGKDLLISGIAGASGEVAGDALRRVATGAIAEAIQRGLQRIGLPAPLASHPAMFIEATANNGITSPTSSYAADKAVNGDWAALADINGYLTAVGNDGLSSGLMGAGAANSRHLGLQLNQLGSPPESGPTVGTGSPVPIDGNPPINQPAMLVSDPATAPLSPGQAVTPTEAVTPTAAAAPTEAAVRPPGQAVTPPVGQAVTPPVTDAGPVGLDTNRQERGVPPAASTARPAPAPNAGPPNDAGTTEFGTSDPTQSETAAGPAVTPSQPSGLDTVHQPETVAPDGTSGTTDAPADGAAEAGPPGGGSLEGRAPVEAGPSADGPAEGRALEDHTPAEAGPAAAAPAENGPSAAGLSGDGSSAIGPPSAGTSAANPSAPITPPSTYTAVHPIVYSALHPNGPNGPGSGSDPTRRSRPTDPDLTGPDPIGPKATRTDGPGTAPNGLRQDPDSDVVRGARAYDRDTATLPEGGGNRPGDSLPLRVPRAGPEVDHQQAGPDIPGDGRAREPRPQSGGTTDPDPGGRREDLADRGRDPVLARTSGERGPHGSDSPRITAAHPGPHADNSHTATDLPGAPASVGESAPQRVFWHLKRALQGLGSLEVNNKERIAILRMPGRPALRFIVGTPPGGTRAHRTEVAENGEAVVDVVISDRPPVGEAAARRWVNRIVAHELAEDAALRNESFVARARAKLRALTEGPAHPDALRRGADPSLNKRSPHDEGHRAEVKVLVAELKAAAAKAAAGDPASARAVKDIEVELGLLLDHLGIGHPDPNAPDARHAKHRRTLLNLSIDEYAAIRPLLSHDAAWRSPERRVAQLARTGEVETVKLHDGTPVLVRFRRRRDGGGTGFTVNPPKPRSDSDGLPVRGPDGRVLMDPAEVVLDRWANIPKLVKHGLLDHVRARLEPPTFVPWTSRASTPDELAKLAEAVHSASDKINDGLAEVDAKLIGWLDTGDQIVVQVRTKDGDIDVKLRLGSLSEGETARLEAVVDPSPGTTRQARLVIAENVTELNATVAEAVVWTVERLRQVDDMLRVARRGAKVDKALLAAVEQAHRMGNPDRVVANLAKAGLLSDQPGSRQLVKGLLNWLSKTKGTIIPRKTIIPLRMFDTGLPRKDVDALQSLHRALDMAVKENFTNGHVRGAGIRHLNGLTPVARIRIDDSYHQIPVEVTTPGQRDFAVQLVPDKNAPNGYRMQVREDASEAAILTEVASALAEYDVLARLVGPGMVAEQDPERFTEAATRSARLAVLTSFYGRATPAERLLIERYANATMSRPEDAVNKLREVTRHRGGRLKGPLVAGPQGRKPYRPAMFRRLVSQVGSVANTVLVGVEYGRSPVGMWTSVYSGLVGNIAQGYADGNLGKPFPNVQLVADPEAKLVNKEKVRNPPARSTGDPIMDNVQKRVLNAASSSVTTYVVIQLLGGDPSRAGVGGTFTLVASLSQAVADKAADPYEMTATGKYSALEKLEPDTVRNIWAENFYFLIRSLHDEGQTPDAQLKQQLEDARENIQKAIDKSEEEVENKVAALHRRRSVVVQPAKNLWNRTGGRVSDGWKFKPAPGQSYELRHLLMKAQAPALVNPLRVGWQHAVMQGPSLYLGFGTTPELMLANMLGQAGRGAGYGAVWTHLSAWEADDKTAVAAARALNQLRESKKMIDELLSADPRNRRPGPPSGRLAILTQTQRDRAANIPPEQSARLQSLKHVAGFVGSAIAASPLLLADIPDGSEHIWLIGSAAVAAAYALGEGVMRVVTPIMKRIDADRQLGEAAKRIPLTPLERAQDATRIAEQAAKAAEEIMPMPVPDEERVPLAIRIAEGMVRAGLGAWRLLAESGTALRPGDNPPGGVHLSRRDAAAVNRLVEIVRDLDRVVAMEQNHQRMPVGQPPEMLRGDLRLQLEFLGLLAGQAGSAARWEAVVKDVQLRFDLDLESETALAELRKDFDEDWSDNATRDAVHTWVDKEHKKNLLRYNLIQALDVMARNGWSTVNVAAPGGLRDLRLTPDGTVRVSTWRGSFELEVQPRRNGDDAGVAILEPRPKGPHRLYVDPAVIGDPTPPAVIGDPARLAKVLHGAVNAWLADRGPDLTAPDFGGATILAFHDPSEGSTAASQGSPAPAGGGNTTAGAAGKPTGAVPDGAPSMAGPGGNWRTIDETPGGAIGQQNNASCVSAVGAMLSGKSQDDLIDTLGAPAPIARLAAALGPDWRGGYVGPDALHLLNQRAPWGAELKDPLNPIGHAVVVDGVRPDGRIMIRDPWGGGSSYAMDVDEFLDYWNGNAVFKE
ncbi:hypothetical protein GCM10022225_63590 [Plantactinospora mayteni]|uniref:Outer membrane channel protein CpnT-like N-terminal domain-containing protein n=1 Tax=Plantactinospora mayteni TaxID=566021 RepID=A0ABQ4F073_9ACTN|nr:hypothetical protein [Plantactinospora mayteni]GIH00288.1 hypothetical protein Pma05_68600 [Plantactinospora mayteni]